MGIKSNLLKITGDTSEKIFEVSNTIPLFWFNFLNLTLLENSKYKNNNIYNDENNEYLSFRISKEIFISNLHFGKKFIERYYGERINLYNDFINYFEKTFSENDILELNLSEIKGFGNSENLLNVLKKTIKNISLDVNKIVSFKHNHKNIHSFIGFDKFFKNKFKNYSEEYLKYYTNEQNEHELMYKRLSEKFKWNREK